MTSDSNEFATVGRKGPNPIEGPFVMVGSSLRWYWKLNERYNCLELYDFKDEMLAFIKERPRYCDRGHYQVVIEKGGLNLDEMDGRDRMYYMDLEAAMWETVEFLLWRMHKISYQQHKGGIKSWAKENMPLGEMMIDSIEYRSTVAYTDCTVLNDRKAKRALAKSKSKYSGHGQK